MNPSTKIGFIGVGNLGQALIKGLIDSKLVKPSQIYASNRSDGKLKRVAETYGINPIATNEQIVDQCDVIIIAVKPQDFITAIESISSSFMPQHIVVSLAAGIPLDKIKKIIPQSRIARLMPNTPSLISKGVLGYCMNKPDQGMQITIEDLFSPLGYVVKVDDGEMFEALTVSCASGTGFVFELMTYWQDWIEERGFDPKVARRMTVETFLGAAQLAAQSMDTEVEDLLAKVASKKGVTQAGLDSMRELEVERALRYSFEKAAMRDQDLSRESK